MELVDIFDKDCNYLKTVARDDSNLDTNHFVKVVHIYIYDSENGFLIQKRSKTKKIKPGVYEITTGTFKSKEEAIDCAIRELFEELSIKKKKEDFEFIGKFKGKKTFQYAFFIKDSININKLILQKEEVEKVKFITTNKIFDMIRHNERRSDEYKVRVINFLKNKIK